MHSKIHWMVACVSEYASRFNISAESAFQYLYKHGGITFLDEYYDAEHLLSFDETIDDLVIICNGNSEAAL